MNGMAKVTTYRVAPFSGSNFQKNSGKCPPNTAPCAICGKAVTTPWPFAAVVIDGGSNWGTDDSPQDSGHMGYWPVGRDCHRQHAVTA